MTVREARKAMKPIFAKLGGGSVRLHDEKFVPSCSKCLITLGDDDGREYFEVSVEGPKKHIVGFAVEAAQAIAKKLV